MDQMDNQFSKQIKNGGIEGDTERANPSPVENQLQNLRMELEAARKLTEGYRQEIDRLRYRQQEMLDTALNMRIESLLAELSAPASQVMTQLDLFENQGKPVQARDIFAVVKRLIRALERSGMVYEGKPGEGVAFDPNRHSPISPNVSLQPGAQVTVRFSGISYQGKMIYKAIVE